MSRTVFRHRVAFYETDAMGIVHHANYVRYLELARIAWMDEHDRPYKDYVSQGLHFSTTRVELDYHRPAAFDDVIEIATWLEWIGGASLAMAYELSRDGAMLVSGSTEHAMVDTSGRPCRIPAERREGLKRLAVNGSARGARKARGTAARSP